jgi:hypothetical protein
MATIFSVIGSHQENPDRLILLGDDGQHYELELPLGTPTPVEPAEDEWLFDPVIPNFDEITA